MKKQISKLAIIVPYRNRKKQLGRFIKHIDKFFKNPIRSTEKLVDYHIFIVEQSDSKPFNQGKLLNIGYSCAQNKDYDSLRDNFPNSYNSAKPFRKEWKNHKCSDWEFTSFAFHDVDLLPEKDVDYSYPENNPIHLAGYTSEYDFFTINDPSLKCIFNSPLIRLWYFVIRVFCFLSQGLRHSVIVVAAIWFV